MITRPDFYAGLFAISALLLMLGPNSKDKDVDLFSTALFLVLAGVITAATLGVSWSLSHWGLLP